ncbi:hypothetical protein DNX69_11815 [Rhodopseudomonas palustris]|uniref:ABC transporter domain-containing protein n=1 Tax=Rhodopseudomonas palustris TaxID=1076 RepID=A0A323UFT8_RHOPL|nr:hypothetical protein DNX69_11815 [Rhodopseudomonas palustris]
MLSEGETQLLSIARALLCRLDPLLLDEATSALDKASEIALHRIIGTRFPSATIIAISHQDARDPEYDRVIFSSNRRVDELRRRSLR